MKGDDIPDINGRTFDKLLPSNNNLSKMLLNNLQKPIPNGLGYKKPTAIQLQSIPILLQQRDLMAIAPTGSGKTAAYLIPLLLNLKGPSKVGFRSLIISPTRELAQQIYRQIERLSKGKKFKTILLAKQNVHNLHTSNRKDILISTPLRLLHEIEAIDVSQVEYIILDEADRLFDLGFLSQIDHILHYFNHKKRKIALFSATMDQHIELLAKTILKNPIRLIIGYRNQTANKIKQELIFVGQESGKLIAFQSLIKKGLSIPMLIFVQSKKRANDLLYELSLNFPQLKVKAIHSDCTKAMRDMIIKQFRIGEIWLLICTDLMARGIDFKNVSCVLNYDFPQSTQNYIHRIGRCGRAGKQGLAITFFTEQDKIILANIAKVISLSGNNIPNWMNSLPKANKKKMEILKLNAPNRKSIGLLSKHNGGLKEQKKKKKKKRKISNISTK